MRLDLSLRRLVYYSGHDVAEYAELEEVAQLNTGFSRQHHSIRVQIKDQAEALERISHQLRQVVVEVLIDESDIRGQIGWELFEVVEDLPEILLN